jgi:hypothetical protein
VTKSRETGSLLGSGLIGMAPTPANNAQIKDPVKNGVPGFLAQLRLDT